MQIGVLGGTGPAGSGLAARLASAGFDVVIGSRSKYRALEIRDKLFEKWEEKNLSLTAGDNEAAARSDIVVVATPWDAAASTVAEVAPQLKGKVVIDTGNPYPQRDGAMADDARARGTGVTSKAYLPGTRLVRAFNAIKWTDLRDASNRAGARAGIPIAGDDAAALKVAAGLIRDAGFDAVVVGDLSQARRFDVDTSVYVKLMSAAELKAELKLPD